MNNHSQHILDVIDVIFNEKKCYDICKACSFIRRSSSRLQGAEFIKAMVIPGSELATSSLKKTCCRIKEFNGQANLSAQALWERINSISAPLVMKTVFGHLREYVMAKTAERLPMLKSVLAGFSSVKIEDSTSITLHEKLEGTYQGTHRGGSVASQIKINVVTDILKGTITCASLHEGRVPDQALASKVLEHLQEGDLLIRDLGYFSLEIFEKMQQINAYFLSRLQPGVKVYLSKDDSDPLDLSKWVEKNIQGGTLDRDIFIGEKKVLVRLVCYLQPKEVTQKRLTEANKRAKRTGRTLSRSKKLCMSYSFFITNVPREMIDTKMIGTVYRLRWECELIFKRWKSLLNIDYLKGTHPNRIECLIWSRLCTIVIIGLINGYVANYVVREISEVKVIGYLLRDSSLFHAIINNKMEEFLNEMKMDASRMLVKDVRHRKTMRERVQNGQGYYETQNIEAKMVA